MESIKKLVKEYMYEELYEADCILRSDPEKTFTKVADNLRGVGGITVVTIDSPAKKIPSGAERSYLKVKFFQMEPTMKKQLAGPTRPIVWMTLRVFVTDHPLLIIQSEIHPAPLPVMNNAT